MGDDDGSNVEPGWRPSAPSSFAPSHSFERIALAELQHRIVNDVSVVLASLDLAAKGASEAGAGMIADARTRIADLAALQRLLIPPMSADLVDASDLLEAACAAMSKTRLLPGGTSLTLRAGVTLVEAHTAWLMATAVVELLTNASKHAFPTGGGNVVVTLMDGDRGVLLRVSDNGRGSAGRIRKGGAGGAILAGIVEALGARMARPNSRRGTVVEIGIPKASLGRTGYDLHLITRAPAGHA